MRNIRGKEVQKEVINKIKKIYRITEVIVRTEKGMTEKFITRKGVRQGCVMNPLLFNLYIADLDKLMEIKNIGGIELRKDRVWSIAYADDLVLNLAKNRDVMLSMMSILKGFLKHRKLELNTEKTKFLIGKGRKRKKYGNVGQKRLKSHSVLNIQVLYLIKREIIKII